MYKHGTPELCFLLIFSVLETRASKVTFACPTGWDIIGTHCYNFVQIRMDFEDARDVCDKYGAQLLVVRDEVEARDVSSVALQRFTNSQNFWVYNGRYEQDSGNGSLNNTFCTGMWQPNEPRETYEDVAIASNMQGRWALTWVWTNLPFVCRKPACPVGSFQCSDGSCINTRWKCDGAYDCKDSSDENDCSDGVKYYTSSTGTVDTSDISADGDFYQWIIEGQPGEVLRIEFDTITIEDHVENVRVYSGGPSIVTSDVIQDIRTSSSQKISLLSKNHFVIITLQSYTKSRHPTVKFNWKPDTEASWKQVNIVDATKEASFISSPYYDSSVSPVSFKREWLLTAPDGELITLEVLDSTMELNAISDFYIVTNVGFVLKELNSRKAFYISSKNSMSVIVKTRSLKKLLQFSASFRKGCDFVTKLSLATFTVKDLPANTLCTWVVQSEVGTNFSLQISETATDDSSDALQIYSGTGINPRAIIGTLNHSTTGVTEYESIDSGVSFTYLSDNVRPSLAFTGNISADCPDLRGGKIIVHSKTKIAGGGYKAQITCPMGFTFKQEEYNKNTTLFAVCNEGGRWDWGSPSYTRTPECQIVYCGFPPTIPNGFVSGIYGNVTYGSLASYQCYSGFGLVGDPNVTCQSDGTWSAPPSCVGASFSFAAAVLSTTDDCPEIGDVMNGNSNSRGGSEGSIVTFSCDPGYSLQGARNIVCLSNKTWSNPQPQCKDVDECALGVCHHNCTNSEGSYSCSCHQGYVLYTENGTSGFYIPAGEDGLKPGDVFQINNTCVPVTCNKNLPVPPANGLMLTTRTTYYYNDQINILCDFGYALENPSVATCQSDGNWAYNTNPKCKKSACSQPPVLKHEASRVPANGDIEPGASLTITCNFNDGSGRVTNKTVFCAPSPHASGRFTLQGDDLKCPEVNCGKPFDVPGGKAVNLTDTTYGSSFRFACDSNRGFTMSGVSTLGNSTVVCQSNGHWGFANLTCEGPRCKDPGTRAGTVQIVRTSYAIDQKVQFNCTRPGFTTVTNDTLVCEHKNGTVNWSGDPPTCEDTQPPAITCPRVNPLDLYSTLVYPDPTVEDNSGFSCLILESGPPSGVSVVTNNVTVRYKATDSRNKAACEFTVTIKDRSEPSLQCPSGIQQDLAGHRHVLFNLTEALLLSHTGDGVITFNPKGPLNLTIETVIPVRVRIAKENGLVKECAFLVSAVSTICSNETSPTVDNGGVEHCTGNGNKMSCVGVCDQGYLFPNGTNSTNYSCVNGVWNVDSPVQSCIKIYNYSYDVSLRFLLSGRKVPPSPEYDADICLNRHYDLLSQLVRNITACGYHNFIATDFKSRDIFATYDEISFTLHLFTTDINVTKIENCAATLHNQAATLFGPTYPVTGNMSCYSPWQVIPNAATIVPLNVIHSNNSKAVYYNEIKYFSTTCSKDSLPSLDNGSIRNCSGDGKDMTCVRVCDNGYLFQTSSSSANISCENGTWTMDSFEQSCTKLFDPIYNFDVSLHFNLSHRKVPPSPQYDATICLNTHYDLLSQLVQNISACGYHNFTATDFTRREIGATSDEISFTLQLFTTDRDEANLRNCAATLQNQSATLFGPTYPVTGNMSCYSPWQVIPNTATIVPQNVSCSNNFRMVDYKGIKYCLPCGRGMFFNTNTKTCEQCQDGYYQDKEGQAVCKTCPLGAHKSDIPRTKKSHCLGLCPEGFFSTSGYIEDNCTACPENQFSISSNSCQPCPNNGSTLGISGATSVTQCSDPCSSGEYSITGFKPCSACPKNFYSHSLGAKMCTECPSNTTTAGTGSKLLSDCIIGTTMCTLNFCYPAGTMNNTACEIIDHRPVCSCRSGFYGDSCNKSCDVCNPNPCYNDGVCTASGLNFTCACKSETPCSFIENHHIVYDTDPDVTTLNEHTNNEKCADLCLNNSQCVAYLVEDGQYCFQYNTLMLDYNDTNTHESYVKDCSVKQLFDGPLCERDLINDCNDTACGSIEFCMDLVGGTSCQCPHHGGSYDSRCAKLDDLCKGNNCSHHGNCISYGSVHAVCECDPGYTGVQCDIDIDECELNKQACLYNGSCQDGENTFSCSCTNGFSGSHCEIKGDFCHSNDCKVAHGGICTNDFHNLTASCTCGEHYMPDSQTPGACVAINYCVSNPCVTGTCTHFTGGFRCDCPWGFEGSRCQHNIDNCVGHRCQNGATCHSGVGLYWCTCPVGFAGPYCEVNIYNCSGKCVVSNTQSACQDLVEDYYCPCKPAYTGKNCSEAVDMCTVYKPCLHGASCSNFTGGYKCNCAAGWTGDNCEQGENLCRSNPCQNGGTCYNLMDQYFCRCPAGTTGQYCEQTEQLCEIFGDKVCSSNGKCEDAGRTVACQCQEEYSGVACELEKDRCAARQCNGGICTQNHLTYFCDCSNVKNYGGKYCNETKHTCSECPKSTKCLQYKDQEGYIKPACVCPANEILVGDTCKTVDRDYDLAFLESFANKRAFLTSESGFYLDKNTSLSVSMWVAAAKPLDDDMFLLALRSSEMDSPFLSVFNSRVEFTTNTNISVELTEDIGLKHSMDKSFTWHFLSIVWATNGSLKITFDFVTVTETTIPVVPPSDMFVFVDIGQSFYGYISQVSVWKTALTSEEHLDMFTDKLAVPQPDSLLLGWTQYSFDSSVKISRSSTAARSLSICDIENTIAKMGLNSPACKHIRFADKTPPEVNNCSENAIITTDYSQHQFNSSYLGYEFTDDTDGAVLIPESQLFSYGAHDIAVSSADSAGNIRVCMTRAYVTPNQCRDTEPSTGLVARCPDNVDGRKVTCPSGMLPSVPTPNYVSCSSLRTYNLDNMYEKPDRIVCGDKKLVSVYLNIHLHYTLAISCDEELETEVREHLESIIMSLNKRWTGLCSDAVCSNVIVNGTCTGFGLAALIQITGLNASQSSSGYLKVPALKFLKDSVADKTVFDLSEIAIAHLEDHSTIDQIPSCSRGYVLSGINCVQCGPGSYYDDAEMNCKLCQLNTYSEHSGNTSCTPCPLNTVTLQRGSSSLVDCKEKCQLGHMFNPLTATCQPCPKNFYQDQQGKSYCFPCPPATGTVGVGNIRQANCVAN